MTEFNAGGWAARVEYDLLSLGVKVVIGQRTQDGVLYLTGITGANTGFAADNTEFVEQGHNAPDTVSLRVNEDAARALYDALAQHFAGETGGRQTRADLMHERGRVDKMIDALIQSWTA